VSWRAPLVKGHGQVHDAAGQHQVVDAADGAVRRLHQRQQARQRQRARVVLDHDAAHAGVGLDQARGGSRRELLLERVDARAQVEVELHGTVLQLHAPATACRIVECVGLEVWRLGGWAVFGARQHAAGW
jgi:hypothetical protein